MTLYQSLGLRAVTTLREVLRSGPALLYGGFMLSNAIAYAYQIVVSRVLRPEDYGVFVTFVAVFSVFDVVLRAFQAWVISAVAVEGAALGQVRRVFETTMRTVLPLGVLASLLAWVAGPWVAVFLQIESAAPVLTLGLFIFASFLALVPRGVLMGLGRMRSASAVLVLEAVGRTVAGATLTVGGLGATGALAGFGLANLAVFAAGFLAIRRTLSEIQGSHAFLNFEASALDPYVLTSILANFCLMTIGSMDQVAVKHFFPEQVAGSYAAAFVLGRIGAAGATAVGWVVFARSSAMSPADPHRAGLLAKGLLAAGIPALVLEAIYLIAALPVVRLVWGAGYEAGSDYVGIVGFEMLLFSLVYVQTYYQISMRSQEVAWPLILATLSSVVLLMRYHDTVQQVLSVLIAVIIGLLGWTSLLCWRALRRECSPIHPTVLSNN